MTGKKERGREMQQIEKKGKSVKEWGEISRKEKKVDRGESEKEMEKEAHKVQTDCKRYRVIK